jgi:WD40 repeat protein
VGDTLLDLYKVTGILGQGGMGTVYKVHHQGWKVDLAVKSPQPEFFQTETDKVNFIGEAEAWVNLGLHPHTVSCYYVRTLGGIPRVFAEYVEGGSLSDWIRDRRLYAGGQEQALARLLDVAIQFAWGLDYAHQQGLIHQDVKPGNVMMTPEGTLKVTDFGLAKARAAVSPRPQPRGDELPGTLLATWGGMSEAYCSPEQAKIEAMARAGIPAVEWPKLTRRTDMWSWGVSVLEMFMGERTWLRGSLADTVLENYLSSDAEDPAIPPMPPALADLLWYCFQVEPEARPRDMQAVATALQEIYQQEIGQLYPREAPKPAEALADSLNNRAVSLLDLGRTEEAERLWGEALQADPYHPEATYNRGLVLWRSARLTDEALVTQMREVCSAHATARLPSYLLAQIHLERGDVEGALELLTKLEEEGVQGAAVATLLSQAQTQPVGSGRCLRTFKGHTSIVNSVCLSGDGRYALSGSGSDLRPMPGALKLWEVNSGRCLRTFEGHKGAVKSVCLSEDGRYALSGSADGTLKLWEVSRGRCLYTFKGHMGWVRSVCLSEDGRYALSGSGFDPDLGPMPGALKLWEVSSGRCLRTFNGHMGAVNSVCLSEDGRYALSGSADETLKLWEVSSGRCLRTFEGHKGAVNSVCLSGDGHYAFSGSHDKTLKLWDLSGGCCLRTFEGHTDSVTSACLSGDGRYALSGSHSKTLKLWEMATGRCLRTFEGCTDGWVTSVSLSGDGRYALSGSWDQTLKLWELELDGREGPTAPAAICRVSSSEAALTADIAYQNALGQAKASLARGETLAAAYFLRQARSQPGYTHAVEALALWAELYRHLPRQGFRSSWLINTFEEYTTAACLSGDGRYALSAGGKTLKLWEVSSGRCLRIFGEDTIGWVGLVCLSGDGRYALSGISGSLDHTLKLWELSSGRCLRTFEGHTHDVASIYLSADGRFALSGGGDWGDKTLKLWEVSSGRCLRTFKGHTRYVASVCLSGDGRYALSGSGDKTLKLWEVSSGRCLCTFEGHTNNVDSACLSGDGRYALSGSSDHTLKLWEVSSGRCLRTFNGHMGAVNSVCLSGDGRYALSGSWDHTLKLWEVSSGRCMRTFEGHTQSVTSVSLSGDGRYALSGSYDKTMKLWELEWELETRDPVDWDEGARPYLETFLTLHTPYVATLPQDREPSEEEIVQALTRRGRPSWNHQDWLELLRQLQYTGYGWLYPDGVGLELEHMARDWEGPPPLS